MNMMEWLEPQEWESCRKFMDKDTFEEFQMLVKSEEPFSVGIPMPIISIVDVCENFEKWGRSQVKEATSLYHLYENNDYYKELYRLLIFSVYGYGNWSNNQRRQKRLPPVKFRLKT